ncbi:hypothetical protein BDF22DRAFT_773293 [Syncephalis plumigaleata]|nr:hypothetical protein BDF22DRAFT_773293 [Syncephalis plumigaleata]
MDTLEHMQKIEQLAEELLFDKQLLVDYDLRRNNNRMALNRMQESKDKKVWLNLGELFIRLPKQGATDMLKKEQTQLDHTIEETRHSLREKVQQLEKLEKGESTPTSS